MQSGVIPNMGELLEGLIQATGERKVPGDAQSQIGDILSHIAHTARTFLGADACVISPVNPITGRFYESLTVASNYALKEDELSAECLRSKKLTDAILSQGQVLISDLAHAAWSEGEPNAVLAHLSGVCSVVALALHIRQPHKSLGVLYLLYRTDQQFSAEDAEQFSIVADYISFILQRAWLQYRYQEVARIGQEINHNLSNVDALFQRLQKHIGRILDTNYALFLIVYQPQAQTFDAYQTQEGHSLQEYNIPLAGATRHVIETRQPIFIREYSKEAATLPFKIIKLRGTDPEESFIYVPLLLADQPLGVLSIQHPRPNAYNHEDEFILKLLANHVALALYNTRLYNSLYQLNETGQVLTRQFASESTLQTIVDNIQGATQAHLVLLYPYQQTLGRIQPPCFSGMLLNPQNQHAMYPIQPGDLPMLALRSREAIFAQESVELYRRLQAEQPTDTGRFYQREKIRSTAVIPLRIEDSDVGVLFVNFRQLQSFDRIQRLLIEGLANYASIAIKNSQTFGKLSDRRMRELVILQTIDRALNADNNLQLKILLDTILRLAHEHIPVAGQASIWMYNSQKRYFTPGAQTGPNRNNAIEEVFVPLDSKGIMSWVVKHKKPARVDDVRHDMPWRNLYKQAAEDTVSELDVPLLDDKEVIGVVNFESPQKAAFRSEDEQFLVTLAGQAMLAIKRAQAYEREKHLSDRFRLLYEVGYKLTSITAFSQIEQAYQIIIDIAHELSQSSVVIRRYDENMQILQLALASSPRYSPPSQRIELNEGYNGLVARENKTLVIDDIYELLESGYPRPADPTMRSLLIAPIMFKDRYYGNLELSNEIVGHFRAKDKEFFEGLAQQLASTIYRLEITQERQVMEQRVQAAEEMTGVGQAAFEIMHRLGNSLGLVESYVTDIREYLSSKEGIDDHMVAKLRQIGRSVRGVLDLSDNLIQEIAGITHEANVAPTLCPPIALLEEARASAPPTSNIEIIVEAEEDVSQVLVVYNLIIDLLCNLVTNAIEAIKGSGCITLRARNSGRTVILEVADTGPGISYELQPKIFDLFYSTKHSSGFGLWSARRNALRNHGFLEVKSEPGQGTTFFLELPRAEEIQQ